MSEGVRNELISEVSVRIEYDLVFTNCKYDHEEKSKIQALASKPFFR